MPDERKCIECESAIHGRYYTDNRNGDTPLCDDCADRRPVMRGYPLTPSDACKDCGQYHSLPYLASSCT